MRAMVRKVELDELADTLTSMIEGGIIVMNDPQILVQQLLQFRNYVRLLLGDTDS